MAKRGRGRPKKITSHNLSDHSSDRGEAMVNSDGKVLYSDELAEFFKIYVPAMCSETMRIPPDFMGKFGGNIPTIVTLRRPSGMTWQVEMKRSINEQYWSFQKGWPEFVKENLVEDGDFMTFSYAGNSVFCVKLFAKNGCRKRVLNDSQPIENLQDRHETLLSQPPG
ncbi:hypothetical protein DH2020_025761 [Rehmannia glutinosa]|uniref:TF-B3 domain-containing protein n=1 Tax=Rehmannia glutinosa TaxID=99300 RepID=A0ABR0VYY6_REHGL